MMAPPPRHIARLLVQRAKLLADMTLYASKFPFSSMSYAHFDIQICDGGVRFRSIRNIVYMHVGTENGSKMWFCVLKSMQIEFSQLVHINMHYFYSKLLKLILVFAFIDAIHNTVSVTNFGEKNKNKGRKTH